MNFSSNYGGRLLSSGFGLKSLTDDECERIHQTSLRVLEKIGIRMEAPEALDYYAEAGCRVDKATKVVKFPYYVVEEALKKAPSSWILYDRYGEEQMILEDSRVHWVTFGEGTTTRDLYTKKFRPSTKQDIADVGKVVDRCEHIDGYISTVVHANDVPFESATLHGYEAMMNFSRKPLFGWGDNAEQACVQIKMGSAIMGGLDKLREKPIMVHGLAPASPLVFPKDGVEPLIEFAKVGLPVAGVPNILAGGTTPGPFAGSIVDANAEIIAFNVLFQTINPGNPFCYSTSSTMLDPIHASNPVGSPELAIISAGMSAMAHWYKLPCMIAGG